MSTLRERFEAAGQGHVFDHWSALDDAGRGRLEAQLEAVDLPLVTRLGGLLASAGAPTSPDLAPPTTFPAAPDPDRAEEASRALARGEQLLSEGKVGFVLVAGGQGSMVRTMLGASQITFAYDILTGEANGNRLFFRF